MLRQAWTRAVLIAMLGACGSDDKGSGSTEEDTHPAMAHEATDAGHAKADAGRDAASEPSACKDDTSTPGNDCADAVGCRGAEACGLEDQSCCVPGFDVANVACVSGLTCAKGGRATCDGPEDCGGKACCVDTTTGMTSCNDSCPAFQLCHRTEDCAAGAECVRGSSFTWWGICR